MLHQNVKVGTRGGTMYHFCPWIVVSWHLRRPQTRFGTRFRTRSQTRFWTCFRFQHFPGTSSKSCFCISCNFLFFPVFSRFFLFFSVFSPVFPVVSLFFLFFVEKWCILYRIVSLFSPKTRLEIRIVSHFSLKTRLEFRIVSHFSSKTRLESPRFQKTGLAHP